MSRKEKVTEGWGFTGPASKCHYFRDGTSLCGRWGFRSAAVEPDNGKPSPDDCSACRRKLEASRPSGKASLSPSDVGGESGSPTP